MKEREGALKRELASNIMRWSLEHRDAEQLILLWGRRANLGFTISLINTLVFEMNLQ